MAKNYIPRNDKEFEQFFRNITVYVIDNNARTVYIALSWQNERAQFGQWSEIKTLLSRND